MRRLTKREARRRAKAALLDSLEETARAFMQEATYVEGVDHDDLVEQDLDNNALRDQLARQWKLVKVGR